MKVSPYCHRGKKTAAGLLSFLPLKSLSILRLRILGHSLVRPASFLAASQFIAAGLSFITSIAAARLLGPVDYGVAALVMAYPMLLWSFLDVKSVAVMTRYLATFHATDRREQLSGFCKLGYTLDLVVGLVVAVLIAMTSWWVARYLYKVNMEDVAWLIIVFSASFPFFSLAGTSGAILSAFEEFRWLGVLRVIHPGITLALVLGLLLPGLGISGMVWATALGHAIFGIAMSVTATFVLRRDRYGYWWKGSIGAVAPLRKELAVLFGWNYLAVSLSGLMNQLPLILLGRLRGPEEAGYYRLATSLVAVGTHLESSMGRVAYPFLSVQWSVGEREKLKMTLKRWTLWGGLPASILLLVTIPFLPYLVPVIFGPDYREIISAVQVMMLGAALGVVFFWVIQFYYASGRIDLWTKAYGVQTAIVIALAWFCIEEWGFFGIAVLVTVAKAIFTFTMVGMVMASKGIWTGCSPLPVIQKVHV